jgi:hypothetical protein
MSVIPGFRDRILAQGGREGDLAGYVCAAKSCSANMGTCTMYCYLDPHLIVITLTGHTNCYDELHAVMPSRETYIDRAGLIAVLDGVNIMEHCWLCPRQVRRLRCRRGYDGCCVECHAKHVQETSALVARVFFAANMGLVGDVAQVIARLLVCVS